MGKNRENIIDSINFDTAEDERRENIVKSIAAHGHKF